MKDLHAFRGVAIVAVVSVHVGGLYFFLRRQTAEVGPTVEPLYFLNETLWHDATIFFALISGLLFSAVLSGRGWVRFYRTRVLNVFVPYATMTALFTYFALDPVAGIVDDPGGTIGNVVSLWDGGPISYAAAAWGTMLTGSALLPYWYIPVLAFLFVSTPAVFRLAKVAPWTILVLAMLPLIVSRTGIVLSWRSVVYFLGVYSIGIYVGLDYKGWIERLKSHGRSFAAIVVVSSVTIFAWYAWEWPRGQRIDWLESVFYVQKLSVAALLLVGLNHYQDRLPRLLGVFGNHAFSIYFLHMLPLTILMDAAMTLVPPSPHPLIVILLIGGMLVLTLSICVAISTGLQRLLGRRSRMMIGA